MCGDKFGTRGHANRKKNRKIQLLGDMTDTKENVKQLLCSHKSYPTSIPSQREKVESKIT
jgi:hypothetical protein